MAETAATNTTTAQSADTTAAEQQTQTATETQRVDKASDFEALVQKAVDRATNKLGNENKKLRGELEEMRKAKLSDDELKQLEMQEHAKELADREKALTEKENRLIAIKEIEDIGLNVDGNSSLAIVDFVMAENEAAIKERVKAFDTLVKGIVQKKVDAVFKANGRTPGVGTDSAQNAGGQNDSFAVRMGKTAAETNKKSQSVLDHYLNGGKR